MPCVIVPARAGVLSAAGILTAPRQRELVRSWPTPASADGIEAALDALAREAAALVGPGSATEVEIDARYAGQSHELTVPDVDAFHEEHRRRNGYGSDSALEVVALRAKAMLPSPVGVLDLPPVKRSAVKGPAAVVEPDCTIWIPEGWVAEEGEASALVLRRVSGGARSR
jgi:N-methylhydantoinase A